MEGDKIYNLKDLNDAEEQPVEKVYPDAAADTLASVNVDFIKEKRDSALLAIQKLMVQRDSTIKTFEKLKETLGKIDLALGKQKSYIEAWNDLLPEEVRNDLPQEIANMVQQGQ